MSRSISGLLAAAKSGDWLDRERLLGYGVILLATVYIAGLSRSRHQRAGGLRTLVETADQELADELIDETLEG